MPAFVLSATAIVCNVTAAILGAVHGEDLTIALWSVGQMLLNMYLTLFILGAITTVTEWRRIHYRGGEKGDLRLHLPAVYVYIHSHLLRGVLLQGGVEARLSTGSARQACGAGAGRSCCPSDGAA
ncbi:MAG: hypothetical protein ACLUNQ_05665 [Oscillospiraceae bacterium]